MNDSPLFNPLVIGDLELKNRVFLAPMTRSRASADGIQNGMAPEYYAQRATGGLLISEAIAAAKQGSGYPMIPGLWNAEQTDSWKPVTEAVHASASKIFAQLFHTGRIAHSSLIGETPVSSSAVTPNGQVMTADFSMVDYETPRELLLSEIAEIVESFRNAAQNAKSAGFDGIEIHAANGYLIDQFLRDSTNRRTDAYGGSIENRARLLLEIVDAIATVFPANRISVRLSLTSTFNDMSDSNPVQHTAKIVELLEPRGLGFVHLIDPVSAEVRVANSARANYSGVIIANGGFNRRSADAELDAGLADAVAFGASFLANPDLPERLRIGAELNPPRFDTFYGGGAEGYIDYPTLAAIS